MKLSNGIITIEVAPHGAELVSLAKGRHEYMWCGDAKYWNRHAPILFPAVGKPCNNEIRIDGQVYTMKQHGFARDCDFEEVGEGRLRMKDFRPENYPYRFALEAEYRLEGNRVDIIVQGCTKPKIANMGTVTSTIYGIEGIKNIPFKFQIEYKIFKEIFILNGNIGSKSVSIQDKSLIHLVLETIKHTTCQN
jgi:hypothetical protein